MWRDELVGGLKWRVAKRLMSIWRDELVGGLKLIDLAMSDEELIQFTMNKIKDLPGFAIASQWKKSH